MPAANPNGVTMHDVASRQGADKKIQPIVEVLAKDLPVIDDMVVVEANEGDQIPGGYRVSKIFEETSKVELAKGREKFLVGLSALAPTSRQVTGQGNTPGAFVPGINR